MILLLQVVSEAKKILICFGVKEYVSESKQIITVVYLKYYTIKKI